MSTGSTDSSSRGGRNLTNAGIAVALIAILGMMVHSCNTGHGPHAGPPPGAPSMARDPAMVTPATHAPATVAAASNPAVSVQPLETSVDPSPPQAGTTEIDAPPVTDVGNQDAAVNWSPWIRLHVSYAIFYAEGYPNPAYRVECWDQITNAPVILDASTSGLHHCSAVRVQSTNEKMFTLHAGFMPA